MSIRLPTYALYGEPGRANPGDTLLDGLHCERIDERSRRHDWEIRPHQHALLFQILHIDCGQAQVWLDGQSLQLAGPCLLWVPARVPHGFRFSTDVQGDVLTVLDRRLAAALAEAPGLPAWLAQPQHLAPPPAGAVAALRTLVAEYAAQQPWRAAAMGCALQGLLLAIGRALTLRAAWPATAVAAAPAAAAGAGGAVDAPGAGGVAAPANAQGEVRRGGAGRPLPGVPGGGTGCPTPDLRALRSGSMPEPAPVTAPVPMPSDATRARAHVARFQALVEAQYRQQPALAALAAQLGITPTQLNRVCHRVLGHAALGVLHRRLLLQAQRELLYTTLSIKQVAAGLGFADAGYFSRFFQRHTGRTPSAWRAQAVTPHAAAQAPGG